MPSPAPRAREQEADGDGAAEQSLLGTMRLGTMRLGTMRRAGVRAPFARRAPAGMRPPPGGRWLTGFKDLWLTGPLKAPKCREMRRFQRGRTPAHSGHRERDQLVGHLARAGLERARRDIEILADHRGASAVAAVRHRRQGPPCIRLRII